MRPLLFSAPMLVLDTETTGFSDAPWSRVVEFAAVMVGCDGSIGSAFDSLVRPEIHDDRAAGAERIHGLTRERLFDAPLAGDVADRFHDWHTARGYPFVTSFNAAFDRPMVDRMGLDWLRWGSCIMLRAMEVMGPAGVLRDADPRHPRYVEGRPWLWPSLADSAAFFGVEREGDAHRALSDAILAARVMVEIRRRAVPPC